MNTYTGMLKTDQMGQQELSVHELRVYMSEDYITDTVFFSRRMIESIITTREQSKAEKRTNIVKKACLNKETTMLLMTLMGANVVLYNYISIALSLYISRIICLLWWGLWMSL